MGDGEGAGRIVTRSGGIHDQLSSLHPFFPHDPSREVRPLSAFTVDAAAALAGPDWLRDRRTAAAERFASAELPSAEEEVWRYSQIGELDLDRWALPAAGTDGGDVPPALESTTATIELVDGRITSIDVPAAWAERGVVVSDAADLADAAASGLGSVAKDGPDVFATLNDAFLTSAVVIDVPDRVELTEPIVIRHRISEAGAAVFPRLVIRVGQAASVTVVDHVTSADVDILSVPLTEVSVARAGRLDLAVVQELGVDAWQLGSLVADVGQEANLRVGLVGLGGRYARLRTDCRLSGRGANGDLLAAYFGDGDQMLDFRTFQFHEAPDTTSNLLFKGAVGGKSRSVYTGLIRVEKEARGTNAFQTNRNVKLSDDAWAESVPNLEIETNDVKCSHASTVGPVDPEQRFYLESRGVPPQVADRLIVAGFFDEVIRDLPGDGLAEGIRERVNAKLDRVAEDLR